MTDALQTPLDAALAQAAVDPAARPDFYRLLVRSEVFVLGRTEYPGEGSRTLGAGEQVQLRAWTKTDGTEILPFFTSLAALQRAIQEEEPYLTMPSEALFELAQGTALVLNPGSPYGKEFLPGEIEALLASGVNRQAETRVVQEATQVLLGQPADYPKAMVQALTDLLPRHAAVKAAYLCQMHDPSSEPGLSLVIGLEGEGDLRRALQDAGVVAAETGPAGRAVDLVRVTPGAQGLSDYFTTSVAPFYRRADLAGRGEPTGRRSAWAGLRALLGRG